MTDISRPPLEQGTALTQLWEAADDLRAAQAELSSRVQDHSMVVFSYVTFSSMKIKNYQQHKY